MVSKGMMSVARMIESKRPRPFQLRKTKEKAASEQMKSDNSTVTPVTITELITKVPTGARSKRRGSCRS
jgi:hypothetical protein